ncbi:MAG TPA: hypothetical protein VGA08_02175 [Candidatus Saccharimonadales bacterium]
MAGERAAETDLTAQLRKIATQFCAGFIQDALCLSDDNLARETDAIITYYPRETDAIIADYPLEEGRPLKPDYRSLANTLKNCLVALIRAEGIDQNEVMFDETLRTYFAEQASESFTQGKLDCDDLAKSHPKLKRLVSPFTPELVGRLLNPLEWHHVPLKELVIYEEGKNSRLS